VSRQVSCRGRHTVGTLQCAVSASEVAASSTAALLKQRGHGNWCSRATTGCRYHLPRQGALSQEAGDQCRCHLQGCAGGVFLPACGAAALANEDCNGVGFQGAALCGLLAGSAG
jgi:hypothetical protein